VGSSHQVTEKGVLQLLLDVKFVVVILGRKQGQSLTISFVVVLVFVLFNSDLSCSRIGFVYEMNVLQDLLFH
jgi:ABC-type transport system involved in Fe-S cluster assembly fused permease/ATPase subunit